MIIPEDMFIPEEDLLAPESKKEVEDLLRPTAKQFFF